MNMFHIATHTDLARSCYAVYDEDDEQYHVYNGPDWLTADFIGCAYSVAGCKAIARAWFDEVMQS